MEKVLFIPILIGFIVTLFFIPIWIKRAKKAGIVGKDQQKLNKKEVVEAGGISVLLGFVLGVLTYIQINTFYFNSTENLIEIFAILSSILIIGFIGFTDDILGWKIGLNKKIRILFLIFAAIPLVVINAGESNMIGIEFGLIYPLFFIPLGIVGASTTFNFIAGYNGLETSQGILILISLAIVTNFTGNSWLSLICLIMVICLIAFYIFNKYPSKIFPGDILTYSVGALIAIIAILGNMEKIAVFFFIPYIIEIGLKVRGKLKKESFAKINKDGNLEVPHKKFYGIEHIAIFLIKKYKKEVHEKDVVYLINLFQMIIIISGLIIFRKTIF
jgi:UDP-N-acetylglucosamine--dolichyl-phosphate N-acetylglucosaminephosphotransferase